MIDNSDVATRSRTYPCDRGSIAEAVALVSLIALVEASSRSAKPAQESEEAILGQ
jgi:hypothetical protein